MENHGAACSQTLKHHRSGTFRPWMAGWVACAAALAVVIILVSVVFGQTRQAPAKATAANRIPAIAAARTLSRPDATGLVRLEGWLRSSAASMMSLKR